MGKAVLIYLGIIGISMFGITHVVGNMVQNTVNDLNHQMDVATNTQR